MIHAAPNSSGAGSARTGTVNSTMGWTATGTAQAWAEVAVPLSGSVGDKVRWGYRLLRRHGPNDGVVPLTSTVWPGGANIVALGPDHLFAPREDEAPSLALLRAIDVAVRLHAVTRSPSTDARARR